MINDSDLLKHNAALGVNSLLEQADREENKEPPYQAVRDRILLEPLTQPEKSMGGVYLPQLTREKPWVSRVINFGHLVEDMLPGIKKGDKVLHSKYAGADIQHENERYLVIAAKDVLLIETESHE